MGNKQSLDEQVFNIKFTAKQMSKQHDKLMAQEKKDRALVKKAIEGGDQERARIYAETAIRNKNQALNMLRMSSRLEAIAQRIQGVSDMKKLTKSMGGVVKGMDQALKTMDLQKMQMIMDKFDQVSESLDVGTMTMEQGMASSTSVATPIDEVDSLINQVAEENGLEVSEALDGGIKVKKRVDEPANADKEADELMHRLEKLKTHN